MNQEYRSIANDFFRLESWGSSAQVVSVTVTVSYDRFVTGARRTSAGDRFDETFPLTHTSSSDRTSTQTDSVPRLRASGHVTAAAVGPISGIKRGQLYVMIRQLDTANNPRSVLCAGYVHETKGLALGEYEDSLSGQGFLRSITGTNPAAGVEVSEAVPTNARWRLTVLMVTVVGGAASFFPSFSITDGTNEKFRTAAVTVAGGATDVMILSDRVRVESANITWFELPSDLTMLPEGWTVDTIAITADDDYAAPQLWVEEWIDV